MPSSLLLVSPAALPTNFTRPPCTHTMSASLPAGVTRRRVPLITKHLVTITNPDVLRKVAVSPDIVRPAQVKLPWLLRTFFGATKVYYADQNRWFISMDGDHHNNRLERRKIVEQLLAKRFSSERIHKLTQAVNSDRDVSFVAAEVAKAMAELVLPLPEGHTIPQYVADASWLSAKNLSIVYNPFKFLSARSENRKVQAYMRSVLSDKHEVVDFVHHLGAGAQGLGSALMIMRGEMQTTDMRTHFCLNPVMIEGGILRIPVRETTVGGIFPDNAPLQPSSLVVMDIMGCAKATMDDSFLFGMGIEKRQCPFREVFFETTAEIRRRMSSE